MTSTSCDKQNPMAMKEPNYSPYPPPLARYEDLVANPKLFMATLEKLHGIMGTKFMIPIIGGRELDLHKLFVEVTSRGGIEKIVKERRWKEVTATFNFPSTATNASFVLRKYYYSLLHHYEKIHFFKAQGWVPSVDPSQSPITPVRPSLEIQTVPVQQPKINAAEIPEGRPASSTGSTVVGVIDGKFESGYLVTVTLGSETLQGILYQAPQSTAQQVPNQNSNVNNNAHTPLGIQRRRRRKKSEIKRRDPAHPKPNRSGYNFFFAEQHARLKPLHPGKDREISRMIGELWNKLVESEKAVYQDKALKDKERYRIEMEDYREKLKRGEIVISQAVPLQQRLPELNLDDAVAVTDETEEVDSPLDSDSSSGESDCGYDKTADMDLEIDPCPEVVEMKTEAEAEAEAEASSVPANEEAIAT